MRRTLACIAGLIAAAAFSGEPVPPAKLPKPAKPKVDLKAAEMDYGPYMAQTVGVTKDNIAYKGIAIPLNKEKTANILFDTELMRVAAAWTGGFLNMESRVFADNNNHYSSIDGQIQFMTPALPGWTGPNGEKEDPRPAPHHDGTLPKDWAKFKGLYLYGDRVTLSYSVGSCSILESFSTRTDNEFLAIARHLSIAPHSKPLSLLAMSTDPGGQAEIDKGKVAVFIKLKGKSGTRAVQVVGGNVACQVENDNLVLQIPPSDETKRISILALNQPLAVALEHDVIVDFFKERAKTFETLTHGGLLRWTTPVATKGTLAKDDAPYVVDTLTVPETNPYKSWMRFTGLDFFSDGRAAVSTWNGDVWIVSGIDEKLESLSWKRFATGLNNPMGVKIIKDVIYTIGRDQITKLNDLNNDGEADFYENINNDCILTTNFHEMCFDLQTDAEGNFYYAKGSAIWAGSQRTTPHSGSVIKVSKDGSTLEVLATGLRAPNGLAISPRGEIMCTDNQGNWVPECPINLIKKGAYYGWVGQGEVPREREKPICWIPHAVDHSSAGLVWVDSDSWGPFKGHLIQNSYDCAIFKVLLDEVGGQLQGGVVKFALPVFPSGIMRARFNPKDGQLYVAGLRGWSSKAAKECCLQRVRYTGKPVNMASDVRLQPNKTIEVTFTNNLDAASASDTQNMACEAFNVVRTKEYGSSEFSVEKPDVKKRDTWEISSAKLLPDEKTISLTIPKLQVVNNLVLKFKVKAADGTPVNQDVYYTINQMP